MSASPAFVALLLAVAVAIGVGSARHGHARVLRIAALVVAAAALYLTLFPPVTHVSFAAGELVVLTADTTQAQMEALSPAATIVALPEAPARAGSERVPDLGTALRRHPEARQLRVIGAGLPARDRDAARGLVGAFDAAPPMRGLVELDAPPAVRSGHVWHIDGRVDGVPAGRVELREPGGGVVASAPLDGDGRFALDAQAKGEGNALFALRVLEGAGARVEDVSLPQTARAGEALNVLLLAGAPDAELKYLRRWAVDAGVQLDSRVVLTEGVALTEGAAAFDADALRAADVAIVDERAWAALTPAQKQSLTDAVRAGLGLLLRVTGPLPAPVADDWRALGFDAKPGDAATPVSLARALGIGDAGAGFTRHPLAVESAAAAALLRADDGSALGLWHNEGTGRVALWWLADGYRLALGDSRARFGSLWSEVLATLARARGAKTPALPSAARVDQRTVLCGLAPDAQVENPQGARIGLSVEPDARAACAAYWPAQPGWHVLISDTQRWPFFVRAATDALALQRADDARATRELIGTAMAPAASAQRSVALPRWPFFLVWLAAAGTLWWFERSRPTEHRREG